MVYADDPHARLAALGLELPPAPPALAAYVPATALPMGHGRVLVSVSGQVLVRDGAPVLRGRVPDEVSVEEAVENARGCALRVLAQLDGAAGLANVEQVLQVTVFVRCADGFEGQPAVADGASELLVAVLGERGRHARAAVGVNALPLGVPVEVTALALATRPTPA
ncbi:MAG TPA: RidA family protein [Candidatus Dormibacteraeota bacterium]|nr:RidA family protein [Candidatus Dormibacteraeota bacterium]